MKFLNDFGLCKLIVNRKFLFKKEFSILYLFELEGIAYVQRETNTSFIVFHN